MRLLPKSDIDKQRAIERQRDVEEGLKLAKKIDQLRSLLPQEEAALEAYRKQTLASIGSELTKAQSELTSALHELELAKLQRESVVMNMKADVQNAERLIAQATELSQKAEKDTAEALISLKKASEERETTVKALAAAEEQRRLAQNLFSMAIKNHESAVKELDYAKKERLDVLEYKLLTEDILQKREQRVANDESRNTIWEGNLRRQEEELRLNERKLADRIALFERTLTRKK